MLNKTPCRKRFSYFLPSSFPLGIKVGCVSPAPVPWRSRKGELKGLLRSPRPILSPGYQGQRLLSRLTWPLQGLRPKPVAGAGGVGSGSEVSHRSHVGQALGPRAPGGGGGLEGAGPGLPPMPAGLGVLGKRVARGRATGAVTDRHWSEGIGPGGDLLGHGLSFVPGAERSRRGVGVLAEKLLGP